MIIIFLFHFIATQPFYGDFVTQGATPVGMLVLINDIFASILTH